MRPPGSVVISVACILPDARDTPLTTSERRVGERAHDRPHRQGDRRGGPTGRGPLDRAGGWRVKNGSSTDARVWPGPIASSQSKDNDREDYHAYARSRGCGARSDAGADGLLQERQPVRRELDQAGSAGAGSEGFEGSLVTSGKYVATWTASPDTEADVFNSLNHVTLTSDHRTFRQCQGATRWQRLVRQRRPGTLVERVL